MVVRISYPWQFADLAQEWPRIFSQGVEEEIVDNTPQKIRSKGNTSHTKDKKSRAGRKLRDDVEVHGSPTDVYAMLEGEMTLLSHREHRNDGNHEV